MQTLLLQSNSKKDMKIFADLAKKVGLKDKFLTNENLEDIGLASAMEKERTGEYIDTVVYLKKIKAK